MALAGPVAILACLALSLATVPQAAAHDQWPVFGGHDHIDTSDGCSGPINDAWALPESVHACYHHDACYGAVREGLTTKHNCDIAFFNDLLDGCDVRYRRWWDSINKGLCYIKATGMYKTVQIFGRP